MRLTTNLATRRYVNTRLLNVSVLAALLVLSGLLILRVREIAYNQAELGRVRAMLASAGTPRGTRQVNEAQLKSLQGQIRFANSLIDRKTVDWLNLLDRLEEVLPDGVTLSQIEPGSDGALKVAGVAASFSGLRALLENMERSNKLSEVYLLSQNETTVGQTQHGITFTVSCKVANR